MQAVDLLLLTVPAAATAGAAAVSPQVRGETPMGGRDEGWGARAFVLYDYIPVSMHEQSLASSC
jgi:hypothetical protein